LLVASTVTMMLVTLGDAKQIGLSPSMAILLPIKSLVVQMERGEQKAPQDLGPIRFTSDILSIRSLFPSGSPFIDGSKDFQYALISSACWPSPFCLRLNSCESPRAPPRTAQILFC